MAEQAEILVSIDLGTTYTGVAWMTPDRPIQVISDWPGSGDRGERKVPTTLIYNADGTLSSWGFICMDDDDTIPGKIRREFFKIFIEDNTLAQAHQQGLPNSPRTVDEAQGFVVDYLRQIYIHIKESIEIQLGIKNHMGGWGTKAVSFLFSVPTTWRDLTIVNRFKNIVRDSGFGLEGSRHTAQVDLTEAEAASVATLKTGAVRFNIGDLFLTVDAGGGTTDLALMRVTSTHSAFPQMSQVAEVRGVGIGATLIDRAFISLVSERLARFPEAQAQMPSDCAIRMARSYHFKTLKHKFGERAWMQQVYKIHIEGVSFDFNHAGLWIEGGKMLFTKQEIQALFDVQIDGIMKKINEQLNWMKEEHPDDQVGHMILAGGLGSSAYVRDSLQQQMMGCRHPSSRQIVVVPCTDPQLVVVRGLLLDHQQRMQTGSMSVLTKRIARASYGAIIKLPYSPDLHYNEDIEPDPYDPNQKWAMRQIEWLIRKGDEIDPNGSISKAFHIRLRPEETTRSWDANIVISDNERRFLPGSMKQAGVRKLCSVKSNLQGVQQHELVLKKKRGTCFSQGYKYYICTFEVRVIVAPADLRFELWFGGQKFSGNHEPIAITWDNSSVRVDRGIKTSQSLPQTLEFPREALPVPEYVASELPSQPSGVSNHKMLELP